MRGRAGLSLGVIAALVVAVWAALASGEDPPPTTIPSTTTAPTTTTAITETTTTQPTTTRPPTTTPTTAPPTTTSEAARQEEVRLILEDLYFRWFEAIYNNDEDRVREVIATSVYLEAFRNAVETMDLPRAPTRSDIKVTEIEILRDDEACLVTFSKIDLTSWRGPETTTEGVNVLLRHDGQWKLGTAWTNRGDLWQTDCMIEPGI